jgi:hydroxymethylbilane synthase|eukprot:COSAG01_NODE_441_length_17032_cov_27.546389_8_plen_142_part_00
MGYAARISALLPSTTFPYAVGQGALGLEIREGDAHTEALVACLHHPVAASECEAERSFLRTLSGGCRVPVGVDCRTYDGKLTLSGVVLASDGQAEFRAQGECVAEPAAAQALGAKLALEVQTAAREAGRSDILEAVALIGA